jgi:hypothetical protein
MVLASKTSLFSSVDFLSGGGSTAAAGAGDGFVWRRGSTIDLELFRGVLSIVEMSMNRPHANGTARMAPITIEAGVFGRRGAN